MLLTALLACSEPSAVSDTAAGPGEHVHPEGPYPVGVCVTLDGAPAPDTLVLQGGGAARWRTGADGCVTVTFDPAVVGDAMIVAAHPEARVDGVEVDHAEIEANAGAPLRIALTRYVPTDNPLYTFADPGAGDLDATTTAACGHCHRTIHAAWSASPHASAARNPWTQDVYAGSARSLDPEACAVQGGTWASARVPGTGDDAATCVLGDGVHARTDGNGACADCHAPGIDGALGGRDLLEATGVAYEAGVHCDVCHKVDAVDLRAPAGVAGRLHIVRPSESGTPATGPWQPLAFGPLPDVMNPRMGAVLREDVFHGADLCAGCHELRQEVLVRGAAIDRTRWPEGTLPIHTTHDEWLGSGLAPGVPCQSCHMPPDPQVGNAADLYNHFNDVLVGVSAGWERPPGTVRAHSWVGPRQPGSRMLQLAAALDLRAWVDGSALRVESTVTNVGAGHAIPTGEPLRSLLLRVRATCDGRELPATGGDVVSLDAGGLEVRAHGEDLSRWPGARPGEVLRALRVSGAWRDYVGWGPFGDGTFGAAQKGLPATELLGEARVLAVADDGVVTLDAPLPDGDLVVRAAGGVPEDGAAAQAWAGAPGADFARVLVGADGSRGVAHHLAVDVARDNRLLPGGAAVNAYRFDPSGCAGVVTVEGVLAHRAVPWSLARERGWVLADSVMARATTQVAP